MINPIPVFIMVFSMNKALGVKTDLKKAIKYYEQANAYRAYIYATQRLVYYYGEKFGI